MTDISNFLRKKDEFTEMREQIGFEIEGLKSSIQNKVGTLNEQTQRHLMIHGDHLTDMKIRIAGIWRLVEQIEDCQNRMEGIGECERVQRLQQRGS